MTRCRGGCPSGWVLPEPGGTQRHVVPPPDFGALADYLETDRPKMTRKAERMYKLACSALRLAERYLSEYERIGDDPNG